LCEIFDHANRYLEKKVRSRKNCFLIDLDALASSFGKRFFLDDVIYINGHGGYLSDLSYSEDQKRIEAPVRVTHQYEANISNFIIGAWAQVIAAHNVNRGSDQIKLIITDLDDTMWRGVIGDNDVADIEIEGWPAGYIEALAIAKQRGILLAIVSKNTEATIRERWDELIGKRIPLSYFISIKINWQPKVQNIQEILAEVNLLSKNVLFVDDNPVERAAAKAAFPDIRVLGANPYIIRRTILWAAETQVQAITNEASARTEMVQAQVRRKQDEKTMDRASFLQSLGLNVEIEEIGSVDHPKFARCAELVNKTNQFNTTGKRWKHEEYLDLFNNGGFLSAFSVKDNYTAYGLVGVLIVRNNQIVQFVMSCRVIGLDIEATVVKLLTREILRRGASEVSASVVETNANIMCRDVYQKAGYRLEADGLWRHGSDGEFSVPSHIVVRNNVAGSEQVLQPAQ
jgi:FkbH-like protein